MLKIKRQVAAQRAPRGRKQHPTSLNGHRKSNNGDSGSRALLAKKRARLDQEQEVESSSGSELGSDHEAAPRGAPDAGFDSGAESDEVLTASNARLREAKLRVRALRREEAALHSDEEGARSAVGRRLRDEALESHGRLHRELANLLEVPAPDQVVRLRGGHRLSPTCVCLAPDAQRCYSAAKDCSVAVWGVPAATATDGQSWRRIQFLPGGRKDSEHPFHTAPVLCMALTSDGAFLATGDSQGNILVWETCAATGGQLRCAHRFTGHRGAVSALAFRRQSRQLFSGGHDRTIRHWSLETGGYVETLFGHTHHVTGLDALVKERCVSAGGVDRSARLWKIVDEAQLVFNAPDAHGDLECVSMFNEQHFATGSSANSIALWSTQKKKPVHVARRAHVCPVVTEGAHATLPDAECWVSCVAALRNSDLLASGSRDGQLRLWRAEPKFTRLQPLAKLPVKGFVNGLSWSADGGLLAVAVGQEQRLGRWWRDKEAKNCILLFPMRYRKPT